MTQVTSFTRILFPAAALFCAPFAHASESAQLIARSGDAAPADVGGVITQIAAPSVSVSDAMALAITTDTAQALVRRGPFGSDFATVARSDDQLPGVDGAFVLFDFSILDINTQAAFAPINSSGDLSLVALVENPDGFVEFGLGAYRAPFDGAITQVWRQGDFSPELVEGANALNGGTLPIVTDDGAFLGAVTVNNEFESPIAVRADDLGARTILGGTTRNRHGDGVAIGENQVFVTTASGDTTPLLNESQPDPARPGAVLRFITPDIAGDGSVTFSGRSVLDGEFSWAAWVVRDGLQQELARSGEPAPGTETVFSSFRGVFAGSEDGAVIDTLLSPDDSGAGTQSLYFFDALGGPVFLAREGAPAPGLAGLLIEDLAFDDVAINERDQVAFTATLVDGAQAGTTSAALFVGGREGMTPLVRTGDTVDVARESEAPDVRTVETIRFSSANGLADNGRIAYTLGFTDGTFAAFTDFVGTPPTACAADLDRDGDVDMGDFGAFAERFDTNAGDGRYDPILDFDFDGDVDLGDFGAFGAQFGRTDCGS